MACLHVSRIGPLALATGAIVIGIEDCHDPRTKFGAVGELDDNVLEHVRGLPTLHGALIMPQPYLVDETIGCEIDLNPAGQFLEEHGVFTFASAV